MATRLIRCDEETQIILKLKSQNTGNSIKKLVQFAVINMPYIPPKKLKQTKNVKK